MMPEETDKREHSLKREVDDLTDYQSLNSLGGAGVAGTAKETPAPEGQAPEGQAPEGQKDQVAATESSDVTKYDEDYNDGSDFTAIDNEGETNS